MLILNRKIGESIIIGDNIEVTLLELADGKLKIGIDAPRDVSILRKEIYLAIKEENQKSLQVEENIDLLKMLEDMDSD